MTNAILTRTVEIVRGELGALADDIVVERAVVGRVVVDGHFEPAHGDAGFVLHYEGRQLPLAPKSWLRLLRPALERLREYDQAAALYRKVGQADGRLGTEAAKNAEILDGFLRIFDRSVPSDDPFKYIAGLDQKVAAWNALIQKYKGTPYEFLARVEEERIDRAKVAFVEANRHRLKEGNQLTILGYSQLVTKHEQSKNIHRYLLDFGDFYMLLAKEYASQYDPEGLTYDSKALDQFVKSALKLYTEVAQVDGILEKVEAQGKIEAARGFVEKMARLNR